MKLGIYVGSFNPIHMGHIKIVRELIDKNYVDKVYIIPTMGYWQKQDLIDIKDRINMCKCIETDNIIVDNHHHYKYQYTYEILSSLKQKYIGDSLYLIIGADNVPKLHLWQNIDQILKYPIIIINRNNIDLDSYLNQFPDARFIIANDINPLAISSTLIRKNVNYQTQYLDSKVLSYIKKHHLYGTE